MAKSEHRLTEEAKELEERREAKEAEERRNRADPSSALMARLGQVEEALRFSDQSNRGGLPGDVGAIRLAELKAEERVTPASWDDVALHGNRPVPGHVVALMTACALVDACLLACPGTHKDNALELAGRLLDEQWEHGMFHVNSEDDPAEHLPEWDAAMAAILYVAHKVPYPEMAERVGGWWRQAIDRPDGTFRTEIIDFIDHGERRTDPFLPARFFYLMENVPLPKPFRPWKVVV